MTPHLCLYDYFKGVKKILKGKIKKLKKVTYGRSHVGTNIKIGDKITVPGNSKFFSWNHQFLYILKLSTKKNVTLCNTLDIELNHEKMVVDVDFTFIFKLEVVTLFCFMC